METILGNLSLGPIDFGSSHITNLRFKDVDIREEDVEVYFHKGKIAVRIYKYSGTLIGHQGGRQQYDGFLFRGF